MTANVMSSPLMLYVIWHPKYTRGAELATLLRSHFDTNFYRNIFGGMGMPVLFRNVNISGSNVPLSVDWDDTDTTAVLVLIDHELASDLAWMQYVKDLINDAQTKDFGNLVIPVIMGKDIPSNGLEVQALHLDQWTGVDDEFVQKFISDITCEFIRMLRHHLLRVLDPDAQDQYEKYMQNVRIFLSHSNHDSCGKSIAENIRDYLHANSTLASFLDIYDIPPGMVFADVISYSIQNGVMLIIYSDSYSSSPWCMNEAITAKRENIPLLVVDCLDTVDERSFPYLGNVPVVRMNPIEDRVPFIVSKLLDEVFRIFFWRCSTETFRKSYPHITFLARPPELMSLATLQDPPDDEAPLIVYRDPPLSAYELKLFSDIYDSLHLSSLRQWQAKNQNINNASTPMVIAISASESSDMATFGLSKEHLQEAMGEIAMYLLADGIDLAYGGDLRNNGFTKLLLELLERYVSSTDANMGIKVTDYLAWPVHISMNKNDLTGLSKHAQLTLLDQNGKQISIKDRQNMLSHVPDEHEWSAGLTSMRRIMHANADARIVLGGRVNGYKGVMPGIAEECLMSLESGQPLFLLGGFGGCSRDIARILGLIKCQEDPKSNWQNLFKQYDSTSLSNGLTHDENIILARSSHIHQTITLILLGLSRLARKNTNNQSDIER